MIVSCNIEYPIVFVKSFGKSPLKVRKWFTPYLTYLIRTLTATVYFSGLYGILESLLFFNTRKNALFWHSSSRLETSLCACIKVRVTVWRSLLLINLTGRFGGQTCLLCYVPFIVNCQREHCSRDLEIKVFVCLCLRGSERATPAPCKWWNGD